MNLFDLKQAANDGVPEAQFVIGILYQNGFGCPQNKDKAAEWYGRAAKQGFAAAQYSLAALKTSTFKVETSILERKKNLRVKSLGGNPISAFKLFLSAAREGFWPALGAIATCFEFGMGTKSSLRMAFSWAKKAADAGYTQCDVQVASMYHEGRGTKVNEKQALYYYKRAANRGNGLAAFSIAHIYRSKKPSRHRDTQIVAWLRRSAELNYIGAHSELYWVYSEGLYGQSVNAKKAYKHQVLASELTEALTMNNLTALDSMPDISLDK